METLIIFVVGLMARLLVFLLLFTLFAMPVAAVVFLAQGATVLHRRVAGTVDAGGARWKPGLAYTEAHSWVKPLWGHGVKVGLDDVARRVLSGVSSFTLPPIGTRLRRGDPLVSVRCGERRVAIPSPVDGIVLERNRSLLYDPALFERDPYRDGWILRLETNDHAEGESRLGAASRAWLRGENLRLTHFLEARLGMASADGGTLTAPPSALLPEPAWREATRKFLRAA